MLVPAWWICSASCFGRHGEYLMVVGQGLYILHQKMMHLFLCTFPVRLCNGYFESCAEDNSSSDCFESCAECHPWEINHFLAGKIQSELVAVNPLHINLSDLFPRYLGIFLVVLVAIFIWLTAVTHKRFLFCLEGGLGGGGFGGRCWWARLNDLTFQTPSHFSPHQGNFSLLSTLEVLNDTLLNKY